MQFIERGDRVNKYVEGEVLNHRTLRHPHVIEFKEVFLTPEYLGIAMEYASGAHTRHTAIRRHKQPVGWTHAGQA